MIQNVNILKLVYKAVLTGMPMMLYNPYSNTPILAPCTVNQGSTYINYKLNQKQIDNIQSYIGSELKLIPSAISDADNSDNSDNSNNAYYLSINIYNCSSPLFKMVSNEDVTRCEINTYVQSIDGKKGTLIIDYASNKGSMDPVYIYQDDVNVTFRESSNKESMLGIVNETNIYLNFLYEKNSFDKPFYLDRDLIELTDNIFYRNGIIDKLYYDKSLVYSRKNIPELLKLDFKFLNMTFENPESVFYFTEDLNFVGSMWHNLLA